MSIDISTIIITPTPTHTLTNTHPIKPIEEIVELKEKPSSSSFDKIWSACGFQNDEIKTEFQNDFIENKLDPYDTNLKLKTYLHPSSNSPAGNSRFRVIPVILWKQYSDQKFFGFFPMLSGRLLPESTGSW